MSLSLLSHISFQYHPLALLSNLLSPLFCVSYRGDMEKENWDMGRVVTGSLEREEKGEGFVRG